MGRLKTEMKMLLMPEDSLKTTRPGPDHHQYQQNLLHSQQHKSQIHETRQTESQQTHSQSHQGPFQQSQSQQIHLQSLQSQSQSHPNSLQQIQSQQSQTQSQLSQQSRSALVRRRPVVPSTLEEAGLVLRRVRRQKKVLEENLEALLRAKTGEVLHRQLEALATNRDCTEEVRVKKTVDAWINTLTRDIQFEMSSEDTAMTSQQRAAGRAVSALRGTGSQTAALRLSAAAGGGATGESYLTRLYGRAPYEGQRRTLKKSPYLRFSSPASPLSRKPRPRLLETVTGVKVKSSKTQTCLAPPLTPSPGRPHDIISPPLLSSGDPADLTVTSVPMAIPLGRPRMDSSSSRRLAEYQQEVTSPRTAPPTAVAVDDGASEPQVEQVEQLSEAPPAGDFMERQSEAEEDEDEEVFSGTDFLCVADVVQQQEEGSVVGEEEVQLDGAPPPPPVLYQGPVFPPQIRSALPAQDQASVLGLDLQRDALELRMVEWVEQQLMSRMILEMYLPPPSDPARNFSTDQSECEERSTSDIVCTAGGAGGAGLQLFVDSSMSVDSALIRQLVSEVLSEQVALMLGQKDSQEPEPVPGSQARHEDSLVQTPAPTPPCSPAPPSRETRPLDTPPLSEPTSLLNHKSPQPITAPEPVTTPPCSSEPTPSAASPPAVHQAPPLLTWGDAELPLDEERLEEHLPLLISVAEEEPPLSTLSPPSLPPAPSPSPPPPEPNPGAASPPSSSSEDSSSSTVTAETEAALRHISEGELLLSVQQEAICSFSSSLQELQEMDFDPPSEGQVRGHDLLLSLLTKMEQGVTHTLRGERPQLEGSWGGGQEEEVSIGEVRDNRTTNPRSYSTSTAAREVQTTSPGQISQCADVSEVSLEATNQDSVVVGDLMIGTLISDLQSDLSLTPPPHPAAEQQQGGARRMEVHLLSITPEEEEEEEEEEDQEEVSAAADTDSSTDDVF